MNRRGFLGALIAAATLDPERLLYVPGRRLISIPKLITPILMRVPHVVQPGGMFSYDDGFIMARPYMTITSAIASTWPKGRPLAGDEWALPLSTKGASYTPAGSMILR